MSHFRKMLFAAAAVASFIGTSNTANAQANPFVCNTSFSPLVVRVEGLRELVGDIVISCTGGNSIGTPTANILQNSVPATIGGNTTVSIASGIVTAPGTGVTGQIGGGGTGSFTALSNPTVPAINISVTVAGSTITNRIFSGNLTDALLFIDEPATPSGGANIANQNPCLAGGGVGVAGVCTGQSYFFVNGVAVGSGYAAGGVPLNVYQAQYGVGGGFAPNDSTITFVGVPIVQPGTYAGAPVRVYRIKNIRVQVANKFQVNGQIQAFISVQNPPANLVLNNAQGVVGFVQKGLFFSAIAGGPYAQCLGYNGSLPTSGLLANTGAISFTEAYGVSFKRKGVGGNLDTYDSVYNQYYSAIGGQSDPRVNYNNESGFYNLSWPTTNNLSDVGKASQGTQLRARFTGVPTLVKVYVSQKPVTDITVGTAAIAIGQGVAAPNAAFTASSTTAGAWTTGTGALIQGSSALGWGGSGAAYAPTSAGLNLAAVAIASDGTGEYTWEVLRADDNVIDVFNFLVAIAFPATTSIVTDANIKVTAKVSGNYAPIAAVGGNGFPSIPSFVLSNPEEKEIFSITNCATNLLYPFVSSVTGFNTGIAVANVSKDPFLTVNETGICKVNFYGTTAGGGIDPPPQSFSKSVPAGQVATFNLLFGGPEYGIQPVAGFQGYIIIQCNFRWAHGFAFVSDPSNLQTAHGYLALILDPPSLRRNTGASAAEQLDN